MHITSPFIAAAEKIHIRLRHHHRAAVTSAHETHTSRQGRQQRNPQPNLDSVNRTVRLVHTDLLLAEEIKPPDVNSFFCSIFMRDKITPGTFPSLWGITLPRLIGGAPAES
jgi:hypothetical protein